MDVRRKEAWRNWLQPVPTSTKVAAEILGQPTIARRRTADTFVPVAGLDHAESFLDGTAFSRLLPGE